MPTYSVQIPVTGSLIVTVEAASEAEAKEAAFGKCKFHIVPDDPASCEPGEFEVHEQVTRGNVCYACCKEINVEPV